MPDHWFEDIIYPIGGGGGGGGSNPVKWLGARFVGRESIIVAAETASMIYPPPRNGPESRETILRNDRVTRKGCACGEGEATPRRVLSIFRPSAAIIPQERTNEGRADGVSCTVRTWRRYLRCHPIRTRRITYVRVVGHSDRKERAGDAVAPRGRPDKRRWRSFRNRRTQKNDCAFVSAL